MVAQLEKARLENSQQEASEERRLMA
ncbi:UNVERIFIED_CONTAM: hypothetical protein GTU68_005413 [Idotea baltica]|nr:hypothetical protein [Idotea baltica]